jgi:hypothetical protein
MSKPRIFLGSSGAQKKLVQALTRGLEEVAHVDPWTAVFNPGTSTLARLVELTQEVDFAAFVFARDDWTAANQPAFSAEFSACTARSFCMRAARNFRPTCSASPVCGTMMPGTPPR